MDSDNKKISQLTQVTSLNDSDAFIVSIDIPSAPKARGVLTSSVKATLKTYFDTLYAVLLASTAANDFQVGNGSGGWVKKTLAETITILRTSLDSVYAKAWGSITGTLSSQTDLDYALTFADGIIRNGKISASVASNNLTVAIKTSAGNDPSASEPVYIRIGGVTRTITSALSVTKNAGTNWCNAGAAELAAKEIDYFVYIGYNTTDGVTIGFSRIPYATIYSDFSATSTNEKYAAISTITNAAAGDNYINIGRFAATLSAGAGYTWTVPTFTGANLIQRPIYETRILDHNFVGTNFTIGSATVNLAKYQIIGNELHFWSKITLNSSTVGTLPGYVVPFGIYSPVGSYLVPMGTSEYYDASPTPSYYLGAVDIDTNIRYLAYATASTYAGFAGLTVAVPFAWANNDFLAAQGEYRIG